MTTVSNKATYRNIQNTTKTKTTNNAKSSNTKPNNKQQSSQKQ